MNLRPRWTNCPKNNEMSLSRMSWKGSSFKEIAEETGLSVNTLLARKRYAVLHLRKRLQAIYSEFTRG